MTNDQTFVFWQYGTPTQFERRVLTKVLITTDALVLEASPIVRIPLSDISACKLAYSYGSYICGVTAHVWFRRPQSFLGSAKGVAIMLADPTAPLFENGSFEPEYEAFAAVVNARIAGTTPEGLDPNPYRRAYRAHGTPVSEEYIPDAHRSPLLENPQEPPNYLRGYLLIAVVLGILMLVAMLFGTPTHVPLP